MRMIFMRWGVLLWVLSIQSSSAAEGLLGVQSARVMSQSMPGIAEETGIFRKYNLEFSLVYVGTSPLATAAMLGGDAQLMTDGVVRTNVGGNGLWDPRGLSLTPRPAPVAASAPAFRRISALGEVV